MSIKDLERKPGPGNYDPDFKNVYSSNPSFSISRKYKPVNPDSIPAPNAVILYFIFSTKSKSPVSVFTHHSPKLKDNLF